MNDIAKRPERPMIAAQDVNPISMMFDPIIAERVSAIAQTMAKGNVTVPEHLRNNLGDCLAIVMQAASWRLNPFIVAQKTHLISGKLGYEAQLVSAVVSSLGILEGRFEYEYQGDWTRIEKRPQIVKGRTGKDMPIPGWKAEDESGLAIVVTGKLRNTGNPRQHRLPLATVWPRNSPLWATAPQQQIAYLATKQWVRKYAPDAILGVYSTDELELEAMQSASVVETSESATEIMARARQLEKNETVVSTQETGEDSPPAGSNIGDEGIKRFQEEQAKKESQQQESLTQKQAQIETKTASPPPASEKDEDEWPKEIDGELVDARAVPWHEDFHSARKTCTDAGHWRKRRGANLSEMNAYETRFIAKQSSGGKDCEERKEEAAPLNLDGNPPPAIDYEEMKTRIKRATSADQLTELIAKLNAGRIPAEQLHELVDLAENYRADWILAEEQAAEAEAAQG